MSTDNSQRWPRYPHVGVRPDVQSQQDYLMRLAEWYRVTKRALLALAVSVDPARLEYLSSECERQSNLFAKLYWLRDRLLATQLVDPAAAKAISINPPETFDDAAGDEKMLNPAAANKMLVPHNGNKGAQR